MAEEHDLLVLARKLRYDLTAMQGKVTELIRQLAALDLPVRKFECSRCGVLFGGPLSLAEHIYVTHDGDVPEHWAKAEEQSA